MFGRIYLYIYIVHICICIMFGTGINLSKVIHITSSRMVDSYDHHIKAANGPRFRYGSNLGYR